MYVYIYIIYIYIYIYKYIYIISIYDSIFKLMMFSGSGGILLKNKVVILC